MATKMVAANSRITFARKHDLVKASKQADKGVISAINYLAELIGNEDADPKLRYEAAKCLIDSKIKMSAEISKDQLTRTIAEAKLITDMRNPTKTVNDEYNPEVEGNVVPVVDFSMIQNTDNA